MKNFALNNDNTISIHYDNLNPSDVSNLINLLQSTLWVMKKETSPIDVLKKSAKLNRARGELTFQLSWDAPQIIISMDEGCIPDPNIVLSEEHTSQYYSIITSMLSGI